MKITKYKIDNTLLTLLHETCLNSKHKLFYHGKHNFGFKVAGIKYEIEGNMLTVIKMVKIDGGIE